jgi:hypothetical protein
LTEEERRWLSLLWAARALLLLLLLLLMLLLLLLPPLTFLPTFMADSISLREPRLVPPRPMFSLVVGLAMLALRDELLFTMIAGPVVGLTTSKSGRMTSTAPQCTFEHWSRTCLRHAVSRRKKHADETAETSLLGPPLLPLLRGAAPPPEEEEEWEDELTPTTPLLGGGGSAAAAAAKAAAFEREEFEVF